MDIWSWLQEVTLLIVMYKISSAGSDLLENIRPKADNPPELNDFYNNVLDHKNDFYFIQQIAKKYQKMKKDTHNIDSFDSIPYNYDKVLDPRYKFEDKRNVHHHHKRLKNIGFIQPSYPRNKIQRMRRGTKKLNSDTLDSRSEEKNEVKRVPVEVIMLREPEKETIHKRVPLDNSKETKRDKHVPSKIFIEPQAEQIDKRTPEITVETESEKGKIKESPKEKKQALDFSSEAVHRTYKSNQKNRIPYEMKNQNDFYYVDLENAAEKDSGRYDDKRRYGWMPGRQNPYYRLDDGGNYPRPRPRPHNPNYYGNPPRHSLSDEVAFEKALTYELDPKFDGPRRGFNNPSGNSLYSVDEGPPDIIESVYPQPPIRSGFQSVGDYPDGQQGMSNERFLVNNNNANKDESSTTESTTTTIVTTDDENGKKDVKHVGDGFIEITKMKRDKDEEMLVDNNAKNSMSFNNDNAEEKTKEKDKVQSSPLFKHSLHPLKVKDTEHIEKQESEDDEDEDDRKKRNSEQDDSFKSRKLQFIDAQMANLYDENYEDIPIRPKRDFLDALGMKNEEDYSEDNSYKREMNSNNTDINNDTYIHECTTTPHSCDSTTKTTPCPRKEDLKNIKDILEQPVNSAHKKKKDKRTQKQKRLSHIKDFEDFEDILETTNLKNARDIDKVVESQLLENKDKIYNPEQAPQVNKHSNLLQLRQERMLSKWPKEILKTNKKNVKKSIKLNHKLEKKEDDFMMTRVTDLAEVTPPTTIFADERNCSSNSSDYEKIAHQMDIENEKLAQVVNGQLASKIVSSVFDALKKKTCLKAKFYSGLSRKHVNFAGTIDFDIFKANETEDVSEARLLLDQITKVLNRLVLNQVRRKLCQRLPDELKEYLDILVNVKNSVEMNNFVPNKDQGKFLFTYQEKQENHPFDMKRIQDTLSELQRLLSNYENMNSECQSRAEPIKDYIQDHVQMLQEIKNCPNHNCDDKLSEIKRDTPTAYDLVQKQLESVGLGKSHDFIPNFDVDRIIKNRMKDSLWKNEKKRDLGKDDNLQSRQYKKLQLAAEKIRVKRENDKKIAEMFGDKKKRSLKKLDVDFEEPVVYSLG